MIQTPLGAIWLTVDDNAITNLSWRPVASTDNKILEDAKIWLENYFKGGYGCHTPFPAPLRPQGTSFQQKVWNYLLKIPPGATVTYGQAAKALHSAPRAVGQAVGANPIPIIIPCHRVVAQNGLGGYSGAGGVKSKEWLLELESPARLSK